MFNLEEAKKEFKSTLEEVNSKTVKANLLINKINELEEQLEEARDELKEIQGSAFGYSPLKALKERLAILREKIKIAEQDKVNPVWISLKGWEEDKTWYVSRVTPKRIYLANLESSNEVIYERSTGKEKGYNSSELDVEATIRAWEEFESKS